MNIIQGIALFLGIFSAFVFSGWLFKTLSNGDIKRVFYWIKNVLMVCFFVSLIIWIIKITVAHNPFEKDLTFGLVLFVVFFMIIDYVTYKILKKRYFKRRPLILGRYCSEKQRFNADMLEYQEYRLWMLATLSIVGVPIFMVSDLWYLISTYFM